MAITSLKSKEVINNLSAPGNIDQGAMIPISTITVGAGGSTAINFSNIPQNYEHLQLRFIIKSSQANNDFSIGMNGSFTINNCSSHILKADGSSVTSGSYYSQNYVSLTNILSMTSSMPSGTFGSGVIDILDYTNTNKTKLLRTIWGSDQNGAGFMAFNSGSLNTTEAMTELNLFNGYSWGQYSSFSLYGIRKAGA